MIRRSRVAGPAVLALGLCALTLLATPAPAAAASLVEVTSFGSNPTGLRMHLYVPDNVAARPGVLVAAHGCGGSGPGFYQSSEFASLADRYGFIVIYPSAKKGTGGNNCFDVQSAGALKHDGNSDPAAVRSMVAYVVQRYGADPARIFATGSSSGGMFTNVLLAVYPDVFAAGAPFMGVPVGCMEGTNPDVMGNVCSNGQVTKTPQAWGDIVRAAYPGYSGARPRVQLWHGTADTLVNYANFTEEMKQWTNVLGLTQTPAFTDTPRSGWNRSRYGGTGVTAPVETVSIQGAGHALPQAGQAALAIAFFGLDRTTPSAPTVTVTRTGNGTVTSTPAGITCGSTCSASFAAGSSVTLSATASSGGTITWGAPCTGSSNTCVLGNLSGDTSVPITFGAVGTTYPLVVTRAGTGSGTVTGGPISCGAICTADVASGTVVTLTATPAAGSSFDGFGGACTSSPCVVTMTARREVTATFGGGTPTGDTVAVNAGGAAAGTFVADAYYSGGNTYSTTTAVDTSGLTGVPVPPQAVFQTERYGEFTYTIPGRSGPQAVTLYFSETYWTAAGRRTFDVTINGQAALTGFDIYAAAGGAGKAVSRTFTTTASSSGQVVIAFTRGGGPDNPKVSGITVAGGETTPGSYTLTVARTGNGTVSGAGLDCGTACSATLAEGATVTLTATPASGASLASWSGCTTSAGDTCTVTMTGARTVTATFTGGGTDPGTAPCANPVTMTGSSTGNFNTTGAVCYRTSAAIQGWGCANFAGRTVSVNGGTATSACGAGPFPLARYSDGYTYFSVSAGTYAWASIYTW